MYANYFLINEEFVSLLQDEEREKLSSIVYSLYRKCCNKNTKILSKQNYFLSKRTHYPVIFFCCPKCKASMIAPMHGFKTAHGLKYCPHCGEPSIDYRFNTGIDKVFKLIQISMSISSTDALQSKILNQSIITSLCSVYEVYLREFYADILNIKYVRSSRSLYTKFLKDCKNDFLNPGKTTDRLRKELMVDYKQIVGANAYKALILLSDYRNVIVHNNGICDDTFISKHPDTEKHSQIMPTLKTTLALTQVVQISAKKLDLVYQNEIRNAIIDLVSEQVNASKSKSGFTY